MGGGAERHGRFEATVGRGKLFLETGTDITPRDRVVVDGQSYDVVLVSDAGGRDHHIEADVQAVT